jgi:VIT1/CCC1 family predicted Fe2+/Mn2+ transporter
MVFNLLRIFRRQKRLERALALQRMRLKLPQDATIDEIEQKLHSRTSGRYLPDMVYGSLDGIITTFASVAGAAGAGLSPGVTLIFGFANLFADGFSMGVGDFLSKRSELLYYQRQKQTEKKELRDFPEIEHEELIQIYKKKGLKGKELEHIVKVIEQDEHLVVDEIMEYYLGLNPPETYPLTSALVTWTSFTALGFLPLGVVRTRLTAGKWWMSGLEIAAGGIGASLIAYVVGLAIGAVVA